MEKLQKAILEIIKEANGQYVDVKDIAVTLNMLESFDLEQISKELKELEKAGDVISTKKKKYVATEFSDFVKGTLQGNARGFCFLRPENKEIEDVFVPARGLFGAFHKDTVLVKLVDAKKREGEVVKILERGEKRIVGYFERGGNFAFVLPDDKRFFKDIFIPKGANGGAVNRDKVVCEITNYGSSGRKPEGRIVEVLGKNGDAGMDVLSIIKTHDLPLDFPDEVKKSLAGIPTEVTEKMIADREDLRKEIVFTIDGEDAKDLDDAISIRKCDNGNFFLGVHIADVTSYVSEDSPLDKEAFIRGTSNYFPDRVIPMLPRELSNGICSLNENVNRLTLSCSMEISPKGDVLSHNIFESVIKTTRRMTYKDVTKMLEGDEKTIKEFANISNEVALCGELAKILIAKREQKGAIDFETKEAKFLLDNKGKVIDIVPYERGLSNRVIEEFMVLANETVAEHMYYASMPFIYRTHEKISTEKLENFVKFVHAMGLSFKINPENIHSKNFQQLLGTIEDESKRLIVNKVLLRNMQKAKYTNNQGVHFGLSSEYYCHFTSPIRRYPDLFIHRVIKKMINGKMTENEMIRLENKAAEAAAQSTERELVADQAERDADDQKKAQFMQTQIGERFEGVISGVTAFGIFVELNNTCEGLVRLETMPYDKYDFQEKMYTLQGVDNSFTLGERVLIEVATVEMQTRRVNFFLLGKEVAKDTYEIFE
ncbi:MAG: ribonuclease R [Bacillota bacterium]